MMRMSHARSSGGAAATPPGRTLPNPRAPLPPSKKEKLKNFLTSELLFRDLVWLYFCFLFVSSLARFFEVIVFLLLEPLGVNFELPS